MIFQHLEEKHKDAAILLRLLSSFEPEAIPTFDHWYRLESNPKTTLAVVAPVDTPRLLSRLIELFCCMQDRSSRSEVHPDKRHNLDLTFSETIDVVKDTQRLYRAISKLVDLSLVRRVSERQMLWIHDLTRFTIKQAIQESHRTSLLRAALVVTYNTFPEKDNTLKERLVVDIHLPQAIKLIEQARESPILCWEYTPLMALCAQCLRNRGMYSQALEWFNIILPEYKQNRGEAHPRTAAILHNMASTYGESGDLELAESTYMMAWNLKRQSYDEGSLEILSTMNKLAACIERKGRLKEGEKMFAKTYIGYRKALGPSNPISVATAHNLALCYNNQGRLVEAETLYRETLKHSEDTVGAEDFGTLKTLGNLAVTVDQSGRLSDAEPLYDRALTAYTKLCGHDNMLTLRARSNVSGLYRQQGRFADAETMIRDALNSFLTVFGPDHFHSAVALYDLGEVLHEKGALDEGQKMYKLSCDAMGSQSTQHPLAFRVLDALGILYREAGDLIQSDHYSALAYDKNNVLLGANDPFTLVSANNRAEYLHITGRYQEAAGEYSRCLQGFKTLLPEGHPHTLMVLNNLGRLAWITKLQDPIKFFEEAYNGFVNLLGLSHACTLVLAMNIARTQFINGDSSKVARALRTVHESFKVGLGNLHPYAGVADFHLGMLQASKLDAAGMSAARNHFQDASDCFLKSFGSQHPNYLLSICMLVRVLRELNELDNADAYQSILETHVHVERASTFIVSGHKDLTYCTLARLQPEDFNWRTVISLPFGETVRLRWGRKNVWREPELAILES